MIKLIILNGFPYHEFIEVLYLLPAVFFSVLSILKFFLVELNRNQKGFVPGLRAGHGHTLCHLIWGLNFIAFWSLCYE